MTRIIFNGQEYSSLEQISFASCRGGLRMRFRGEDNSYLKGVIVALMIIIAVRMRIRMGGKKGGEIPLPRSPGIPTARWISSLTIALVHGLASILAAMFEASVP
ncbi:MAG: hypothetical protein GHCLOJNM_00381 [bacterium]|nr:hypothetical protein [bacterium]